MTSTLPNSETAEINRLLQAGIQAAKAGQQEQAQEFFLQVVEQDEENIQGWLWLSGVLTSLEERRTCLENVLALDPNNAMAQKGLALLHKQVTAGSVQPASPPAPAKS